MIFKRIEGFVFYPPSCPPGTHYVVGVFRGDLEISNPAEAAFYIAVAISLPVFEKVDA